MNSAEARVQWLDPAATGQSLAKAGNTLAQSDDVNDHRTLYTGLGSTAVLSRLDSDEDYVKYGAAQLRVAGVLKRLMMNPSPHATTQLVATTRLETFRDSLAREELLVRGLAMVRPPPADALEYWRTHAQPYSILVHITVDALCTNGTQPAIVLLEATLLNPDIDVNYKILWFRDPMLRHRNDVPLLQLCLRLLRSSLSRELKLALVEALTDHQPDTWYPPDHLPMPPPRAEALPLARQTLREILQTAKQELTPNTGQLTVIDRTLAEIDGDAA